MGIGIYTQYQNLEELLSKKLQFQVDKNLHKVKVISVWRVAQNRSQLLKWPFRFLSTSSYIIIVSQRLQLSDTVLSRERTSLQLAEMLFGAQFLCFHLKISKSLMINNRQYQLTVYSFYGDSQEDDLLARASLTYYVNQISSYLQFGAAYLTLTMLNQSQPVYLRNQLKQYIDFDSDQYEESQKHIFFRQQLFKVGQVFKNKIEDAKNIVYYGNFTSGYNKVPHIIIKQKQSKMLLNQNADREEEAPFACQITQINIKAKGKKSKAKVEGGNIQSSNILFEQLQIGQEGEQVQKMEKFLEGLFLGNEKASKSFAHLNQNHIKLIINCAASTCKNWFLNEINYKWIDMPDPSQQKKGTPFNIQCLIYQISDLAGKCLAEPSGVLIHCNALNSKQQYSCSRSGAILVGLLMTALKISYEDALQMMRKKQKITLPTFMESQLKSLEKRRKQKPKGFRIYIISSYSINFPGHIVAKYIGEAESIHNIQGVENFSKYVFVCVGQMEAKIMIGRQCQWRQEYQMYAKEHIRLLGKYEGFNGKISVDMIEKTFRKQPKIQTAEQIIILDTKKGNRSAGFLRNQELVLKYPILRPVWEKKKDDGFYFTIKQKNHQAEVIMNKGVNWIGYQEDKEQFFQKIISCYLSHVAHDKIFIREAEQDTSLFEAEDQFL